MALERHDQRRKTRSYRKELVFLAGSCLLCIASYTSFLMMQKATTASTWSEATKPELETSHPKHQKADAKSPPPLSFLSRNGMAPTIPPNGSAVEIGVYDGDFAALNLQSGYTGRYYMVDVAIRPMLEVRLKKWLTPQNPNIQFLKMKSTEAGKTFEDDSLDFVYIDAMHTHKAVAEDCEAWWPKVKPGGLFSGHDYCVNRKERSEIPELKDVPWCGVYDDEPEKKHRAGQEKSSMRGSVQAVREFAQRHGGLTVHHTMEGRRNVWDSGPESSNPSWYIFKPLKA